MNDNAGGLRSLWSLAGSWHMEREIVHGDGCIDRLSGLCTFSSSGPRLVQYEDGLLETATGRFHATRTYIWAEANRRLDVHFEDMRPFHSIPIGDLRPETVHLCPPDRYQVTYDFCAWPKWSSTWQVEGPRKSYRMETSFFPKPESADLARAETAVHNAANTSEKGRFP